MISQFYEKLSIFQLCTNLYLLCLKVEQLEIIQKDQTKQVTYTKCWLLSDSAQPSLFVISHWSPLSLL